MPSAVEVQILNHCQESPLILKGIQQCEDPRPAKAALKRKYKVGGLTLTDFKAYHTDTLIRTQRIRV